MTMIEVMSVSEAASGLGLSQRRVRALIDAGRLPANRVGRSWVVDGRVVERFMYADRHEGRPLNRANAWALLALLAGEQPGWVSNHAASRLRRVARNPDWLIRLLRHSEPRSNQWSLWLPLEDRESLANYSLVASGLSAQMAISQLSVLPREDEPLEVYASEAVANEIERRFLPERSEEAPNVIIRIPSRSWVLEKSPEAPLPVVAADLLPHQDSRVRRAAEDALRRIAYDR